MRYLAALTIAAALAACDQSTPTGPVGQAPRLSASSEVNLSGKGTAELLSPLIIETHVSFVCPEGSTAHIAAQVTQKNPDGTSTTGAGAEEEPCRGGPNEASVFVTAGLKGVGWAIDRAHATWTMTVDVVKERASDEKDILITRN